MTGARTVIATMKDEGPFILEWVAYYRLIGFDRLVVFTNDCSDGSDRLLDALDRAGLVRHFDNTATPEGMPLDPQNRAYRRAWAMEEVRASEWVLVVDADEFFNIHAGEGRLDDLLAALPDGVDALGASWRVFGTSGITAFEDRPLVGQFHRAAPRDLPASFNHYGIKTLFRPGPVHRLGVHRPFFKGHYKRPEVPLLWVNGSGDDVTEHFRLRGWSASRATVGYDLAQVNHYMTRSAEVFLMKRWRGTANSSDSDRIDFGYFSQFNSNHEEDRSIRRWDVPVREEVARLCVAHPELATLHAASVGFYRERIATLKTTLRDADPATYGRLFDAEVIRHEMAQQEVWLAGKRGRRMAPPAAALAPVRVEADDEDETDLKEGEPAPQPEAPQWLADLRHSQFRQGFYHSGQDFAAVHVERTAEQLVVSFDNLSSVRDPALARDPWGYEFICKLGHSQLGILSFQPNWFRDPALFAYLERLRDDGFFARYRRVALMGTSMGAYGAAAFAALAPGATIVALSPQSTLDPQRVPWEVRFRSGQKQDWSGPYADATEEAAGAGRVYLFYDPHCEPDRRHAERFHAPNVMHMRTRHSGHKSALFLRRAGLLSGVVEQAIAGTLTERGFYALYRQARGLPWFLNALTEAATAAERPYLVERALRHIEKSGRAKMAASIARRLEAGA